MTPLTVDCPKHGKSGCMIVCLHVIEGVPPVHLIPITSQRNGEAYCRDCSNDLDKISPDKLRVVCNKCFQELARSHQARILKELVTRYGVPN